MLSDRELLKLIKRLPQAKIAVVGDLMADRFIYGDAQRLSPEAPVPVVRITKRTTMPGGAANVARNVLALGGSVALFGVLGEDEAGAEVRQALGNGRADLGGVINLPGRQTTIKTRIVARAQHMLRYDEEHIAPLPATATHELLERFASVANNLDVLVFSDYAKGVASQALVDGLWGICGKHGVTIVVDPKPENIKLFSGADVIKPNLDEALKLSGLDHRADSTDMQSVCQRVAEHAKAKNVVVTAGMGGMHVLAGGEYKHLAGFPREVYDVVGAGDTTLAAIAMALACGADLLSGARLGNLAGSIAVGKLGTAVVDRQELSAELTVVVDGQA